MKLFLFASILLAVAAVADDRLRDVQGELKSQGFFYGEVDGKPGPETAAALRRYQIRNGLQVTGTVNDETLAALGMGGKPPEPEPAKPAPPRKASPGDQVNPPPPSDDT